MENPRSDKVAVVDEVRAKLDSADAVLLTEYRGLTVAELAQLRIAMGSAGGEYKVYKNTLVRLAARQVGLDLDEILVGPTALAFVSTKADGTPGDVATVAKVLTDFAKGQPLLVLKGGVLGESVLDAAGAKALSTLPTGPEIYSRLAGAVNGNARGLASVISGVNRSLAYVLQACIDAQVFAGDPPVAAPSEDASAPADEPVSEVADAADEAPADEAVSESTEPSESGDGDAVVETPAADDAAETEE